MYYPNFYAFTGGPGSGKTSVLSHLSKSGYIIVPETAREIIKDRIRQGLSPRPALKEFARLMLEKDLDNFKTHRQNEYTVLFDRSFVDSLCLLHKYDKGEYDRIKSELTIYRLNTKVFIFPPWSMIYKNDEERDQTFAESVTVFEMLSEWYTKEGYTLLEVPKESVEERIKFILHHIEQDSRKN